jgi:uncharacterized protein involved in response to NO
VSTIVSTPPLRGEAALVASSPRGHRWRMLWLHGEPHRFAFTCGAVLLAIGALWWATVLTSSALGLTVRSGPPATQTHGLVMTFAFMPLFFAGFLANAGARWLGHPPMAASGMTFALALQSLGWLVFLFGANLPTRASAATTGGIGLLMATIGWTELWLRFVVLLRTSTRPDRVHAGLIVSAGGVGVLAMLAATVAVSSGDRPLEYAAVQLALWLFEGCTFAAAAHRMIPFLGGAAVPALDARRPQWLLEALAAIFVLEGLGAACEACVGQLPVFAQWTRILLEGVAGAALLALAVRWGFVQNLRIRLLAMLRLGVAWLGLAFVLFGLSHALSAATAGGVTLGAAPLHAYTMGFLGSTMFTMVTRFICGQARRTVVTDDFLWCVFWLIQATIVARVTGAIMASFGVPGASLAIAVAAIGWAIACTLWALRYVPWLAVPRRARPRRVERGKS